MQNEKVEVSSEAEAIAMLPHYFRSFELLALQAVKDNDGDTIVSCCTKRDAAVKQYCELTGISPRAAAMSFMQPSGLI